MMEFRLLIRLNLRTYNHGRHLDHGPLVAAIVHADVRLYVAMPLQLQAKDGIEGFIKR